MGAGKRALRGRRGAVVLAGACAAAALLPNASLAGSPTARAAGRSGSEAALLTQDDRGLYLAFCPGEEEVASVADASGPAGAARAQAAAQAAAPRATLAMANHTGWPADECLKMDKGPVGVSHTLVGLKHVHNYLLGGYGNDTIYGGDAGDVIWGDYHPEGQPESQRDYIHGGAGTNWIYSSHGYNEIWTGTGDDHLALVYGHGIVYCSGSGLKTFVMRYLPQNRPWTLVGCTHKVLVRYRA
ncbi:MAG TPA: hypothetical protein VMF09_06155 [Solirubrobacteraceae bacterium]|nr:hypothetical protein [Solirubrobacteraceae bacterium]